MKRAEFMRKFKTLLKEYDLMSELYKRQRSTIMFLSLKAISDDIEKLICNWGKSQGLK